MPYADPEQQREAMRRIQRAYRERVKRRKEFIESERERKRLWYAANAEKVKARMRRYRKRIAK